MTKKSEIVEYLNHKFVPTEGGGICKCKVCDLRVCIRRDLLYIKSCLYLKDDLLNTWAELDLTCEDVIIKNIIE